ncbi:MAG: hypothetical protein B6D61_09560 [Bacteroidetes bacterium 4484_249]|nr:MAG: hypothetical protein B6D61_09560 [Bacteroidetes bacterium 4484_249]
MNLQYISDNKGKTTGVFIPIQDWEKLKNKYSDLKTEENQMFEVPEWHKDIIRQRLKDYKENPNNVLDWDNVQDNFKFD